MSPAAGPTVGRSVDWRLAGTVGVRLARPAPPATAYTLRQVVEDLAAASRSAESPVREVTGLADDHPVADARVVDRAEWIRAAADSMRVMTGGPKTPPNTVSGRLAGAQTGAVLAFLSSGILGQYDPFTPGGQERSDPGSGSGGQGGTLLLVYPNVIAVERQLRVPARDFRMWVCLHEVTHRVQFTANPWLSQHMLQSLETLTTDRDDDVREVVGRLAQHLGRRSRDDDPNSAGVLGLLRAVQSEPQRRALDRLLVLGTLLEGHADHVMDAVGPTVVPAVQLIRSRFDDRRRRRQSAPHRLLRALLGIDAKMAQYTRGKAFVDHVVGTVGMARFNAVWSGPDTLPLAEEIESPQRWIDRVL